MSGDTERSRSVLFTSKNLLFVSKNRKYRCAVIFRFDEVRMLLKIVIRIMFHNEPTVFFQQIIFPLQIIKLSD